MVGNGVVTVLERSDNCERGSNFSMEDSGIDSDPKQQQMQEDDKLFPASDSSCSSTTVATPQKNNAKQLHRKLEQRIEQAKKIQRIQEYKKNSSLIPIQRLPIPNKSVSSSPREQQPLVDWETDESSDEDINFFPLSRIKDGKQELTDTFSIEDFELSPDEDDLNLLPPKPMYQRCVCCVVPVDWRLRCSKNDLPAELTSKPDECGKLLMMVSVSDENQYEVHLQWQDNQNLLPSNYRLAKKRVHTVSKKLEVTDMLKVYSMSSLNGRMKESSKKHSILKTYLTTFLTDQF